MDEPTQSAERRLTRQEISTAITGLGWRLILGALQAYVLVTSLAEAARVVAAVADATGARPIRACGPTSAATGSC